jgi:hypothetical protein
VTLPPRSTAPTVAGCRLVGCSVVSGRPLRSRAVAGVSMHVCVCLGPVLASHATSLPAAAAAALRGRGRVHIAGWSCGGVGPVRALSHVFFFSTLVRCGEYRSQTGIQRKLNFVSVRTIKEGSSPVCACVWRVCMCVCVCVYAYAKMYLHVSVAQTAGSPPHQFAVCVCLGPVLASHATSLPAAAAAAWRGRGRVHIAGWSCGGVGPVRGLRGGGRRGWCEEWARRGKDHPTSSYH